MAILTVEGIVENGQIRLREKVVLPEHTKVYVVIPDTEPAPLARAYSPRLAHPEQVADSPNRSSRWQRIPSYDATLDNPSILIA